MVGGDKKQIEQCTLNVPGREVLVEEGGDQPPPEARKEIEAHLKDLPLTRLKVGQQITLPGGKTFVMTSDMINESRQQLTGPDIPFPFIVVKEKGQWKVDPTPVIAARRTARQADSRPATTTRPSGR
jgi:hypothetical protein